MIVPTKRLTSLRIVLFVIFAVFLMQACVVASKRTCIPEAESLATSENEPVVFRDNLEYVLSINAMRFSISDTGTKVVVMDIQNCHNIRVNGVARARFFDNDDNEVEDTMPWQTLILPPGGVDIFRAQSYSQAPANVVVEIEIEADR